MRLAAALALATVVTRATGVAAGDAAAPASDAEPIQLAYSAPDGCPDDGAFFAQLQHRARAIRVTDPSARSFRVEITADGDGFRGRLEVSAVDGATTTRDVHGATCVETVSALALISALALDDRGSAAAGRRGSIEDRAGVARVTTSEARQVRPLHLALGTGVEVDGGIAPAGIYTVGAFAALRRTNGWQLRLGFARSARSDVTMPEGDASFRWTIATLDACPLAFTIGRWSAAPCAGVQGGVLTAIGSDVGMASNADRPWLAPDATVRLRVAIGRFAVELAGMVAAPLIRDRFYIAPSTTVDHVPPVTAGAQLALSVDLL